MVNEIPPISELLKNPNINESILDAFSKLIPQPTRIPKDYPYDFSRELTQVNHPFNTIVYGAYMMEWEWHSLRIYRDSNPTECPPKVFETYFKKYADGFKYGYFNFIKEILEVKTEVFNTEENKAQAIYDYANLKYPGMIGLKLGNKKKYLQAIFDGGIKRGYFYRSWCIILESHKTFEPFFINSYTESKSKQKKTTYRANLTDKQIQYLFDSLKKNEFIHNDASYDIFYAIFDEIDLNTVQSKIDWIGANNLLAFLIDMLIQGEHIEPGRHWATANHCFTNSENLANASQKNSETRSGQPKKGDIVLEILKRL